MDLKKYLDSIPSQEMMSASLVKSYCYQLLQAILFCHQRRVLHRDLKPLGPLRELDEMPTAGGEGGMRHCLPGSPASPAMRIRRRDHRLPFI